MRRYGFEIVFGFFSLGLFVGFCLWQTPSLWEGSLTHEETDRYLADMEKQLPMPPNEKNEFMTRLRAWAVADDGKPVYMLNLMRYYPQIRSYPGAPSFDGTPEESNRYYESKTMPLLFKRGGYPLAGGSAQGKNLVGYKPDQDDWSRVFVVRYPNRRAFLSLLSDPAYAPNMPYKMIALHLALVPVSGQVVIPDLRFVVGATLLVLFLAMGWIRAVRRAPERSQQPKP